MPPAGDTRRPRPDPDHRGPGVVSPPDARGKAVPPLPFVAWGTPLVPATFVERPNRFLVRARVEGASAGVVDTHLADPGRLEELLVPGVTLGLRPEKPSGTRRTRWTVMLAEAPPGDGGGWVSLNTTVPNRLVREALVTEALQELKGWSFVRHEVPWGDSRLDFLMESGDHRRLYIEAKSVTLVRDGVAFFPDAVTARGARHLEELIRVVQAGHEAMVIFVLQRPDASRIVAARDIDPTFSDTLARAAASGVRVVGRRCHVSWDGIRLGGPVPVETR